MVADYVELTTRFLQANSLQPVENKDNFIASLGFVNTPLRLDTLKDPADGKSLIHKVFELLVDHGLFMEPADVVRIAIGLIHSHIILYGPPGTGKTSLVTLLSELFRVDIGQIWTANAEWTTFDVIGGLAPKVVDGKEVVSGCVGKIVRDMLRCCERMLTDDGSPQRFQAAWSVVDEMNRCDLDKAFGDLFTALGGGDARTRKITLPFMDLPEQQQLYVPGRFRLIGTINTYDKDYVQEFSVALSRRFRFYLVDIPPQEKLDQELEFLWGKACTILKERLANWGVDDALLDSVWTGLKSLGLWDWYKELVRFIRWGEVNVPIGSAQILDVLIGVVTRLVALDQVADVVTGNSDGKQAAIAAMDHAISEVIISQVETSPRVSNLVAWLTQQHDAASISLPGDSQALLALNRRVKGTSTS